MSQSDIVSIIRTLDCKGDIEATRERLVEHGEHALPMMLECLPNLRTWQARNAVVYTAIKFARRFARAKEIGLLGLADKSKRVRQTACALAAFSLDHDFIKQLIIVRESQDTETALEAGAAINAIQHQNHHLFMDRGGTGRVTWNVMGSDIKYH